MAFNVKKVYRTPAGWVKQLDSGEILGPVETKELATALEKSAAVEDVKPVKTSKKTATDNKE